MSSPRLSPRRSHVRTVTSDPEAEPLLQVPGVGTVTDPALLESPRKSPEITRTDGGVYTPQPVSDNIFPTKAFTPSPSTIDSTPSAFTPPPMHDTTVAPLDDAFGVHSPARTTPNDTPYVPPPTVAPMQDTPPTVERVLAEHGFKAVSQVTVDGVPKFVKSYDLRGNTSYVDLDQERITSGGTTKDLSYHDVTTVSQRAPEETRISRAECMQLNVGGLLYDCDGEICTLTRDHHTLDIQESLFAINTRKEVRQGYEHNAPMPYPIVRLSEVMMDANTVMKNVAIATQRIRAEALFSMKVALSRALSDVAMFADNVRILSERMTAAHGDVLRIHDQLHRQREAIPVPVPHEKHSDYLAVLDKLNTCGGHFDGLVMMTRKLKVVHEEVLTLNVTLSDIHTELRQKY